MKNVKRNSVPRRSKLALLKSAVTPRSPPTTMAGRFRTASTSTSKGIIVLGIHDEKKFVNKATAGEITKCAISCIDELNKMLFSVRERCSDEEFKSLRRGVGHVMSELQDRITDPVYREHPELIPKDANYLPSAGPTLGEITIKKS